MNYYFGVWGNTGHHLWTMHNSQIRIGRELPEDFPMDWKLLDTGLLPPGQNQTQGLCHVWHTANWSILTFWDRTGDRRPGSCSAFVAQWLRQPTDAELVADFRRWFPEVAKRIGELTLPDGTKL